MRFVLFLSVAFVVGVYMVIYLHEYQPEIATESAGVDHVHEETVEEEVRHVSHAVHHESHNEGLHLHSDSVLILDNEESRAPYDEEDLFRYENLMKLIQQPVQKLSELEKQVIYQQILSDLAPVVEAQLLHPSDAMLIHARILKHQKVPYDDERMESLNTQYHNLYTSKS